MERLREHGADEIPDAPVRRRSWKSFVEARHQSLRVQPAHMHRPTLS
ncbi:MAG: hypothetical protein U0Q18_00355 [Bryobacteraceae bacterium]